MPVKRHYIWGQHIDKELNLSQEGNSVYSGITIVYVHVLQLTQLHSRSPPPGTEEQYCTDSDTVSY